MVSVALLPPAVAGQNSLLKTFGIALTGAATTANLSSSKAHDQFEKAFKSFEDDLVRANAGSAAAAWTGGKPNVDTDAIARDIIKHGRSDPRYQHWLKALHGDEQKGYEYACARNSAMNDRNTDMVNAIISLAYHASNKEICLLSEDDPDFLMHITQFARLGLTGTAEYGKNVDKIIEKGRAGLAELSRERARPARKLLNDVALGNGSDGIVDRIVLSGGFWSLGYLPMASSATDVSRYSEAVVSTARILSEGKTKIQSLLGKYGADTIERALELLGISDRQILNYAHCAALGGVGSGGLLRAPWSPQGKAAYNAMACALRMRAALVDTNGAFGSADWTLGSAHAAVTSGVKKAEVYRYPDQVAHAMIYGEASTKQWWIGISEAQSVFGGLNFNHAHWSNKRASTIELINNTVINTTAAKDSGLFVLSKDGFRRIEIALDNLMAKYNGPNKALYRMLLGEMTQNVTMATGNVAKSIEFAAGMVGAIHTWNAGVVRGLVNLQVINTQLMLETAEVIASRIWSTKTPDGVLAAANLFGTSALTANGMAAAALFASQHPNATAAEKRKDLLEFFVIVTQSTLGAAATVKFRQTVAADSETHTFAAKFLKFFFGANAYGRSLTHMVNYIKSEDNKTKAVVSAVGFFNDLAAGSYTFFSSWMKFNNKFHKMVNPALAMVSGAMMLAYNLA